MNNNLNIVKTLTKEDEEKRYTFIWTHKYENSKFASYRIIESINCKDVLDILNKPHGLKSVMEKILLLLIKKDKHNCKYESLSKKFNKNEFEDAILILLNAGMLKVKEINNRPRKMEEWSRQEIILDSRVLNDVKNIFYNKDDDLDEWSKMLLNDINRVMIKTGKAQSKLEVRLDKLVSEGIKSLTNDSNRFPVEIRYRKKFKSVLMALVYGRYLIYNKANIPLRTLSSMIWDDTKVLEKYINVIKELINCELSDIGITRNPDTIWLYGGGRYELMNKYTTSLMSAIPVILSEITIKKSVFFPLGKLKNIIIIENLTVFTTILNNTYYEKEDSMIIWSHGYWNNNHKKILADILNNSFNKINVYIWTDLDVDGLLIASKIYTWFIDHNVKAEFLLMGIEEYNICKDKRKVTQREINLFDNISIQKYFGKIVELIRINKTTVEQEKLLADYKYVEFKLP